MAYHEDPCSYPGGRVVHRRSGLRPSLSHRPAGISNLPAPALILSLPAGTETLSGNLRAGTSHFAQFDTDRSQPVSLSMVFMLIALFTLGVRLMILRQAHSLAEHERHSHHGRAQMFQALHEEQSSRR
jgi:hypothetical protein